MLSQEILGNATAMALKLLHVLGNNIYFQINLIADTAITQSSMLSGKVNNRDLKRCGIPGRYGKTDAVNSNKTLLDYIVHYVRGGFKSDNHRPLVPPDGGNLAGGVYMALYQMHTQTSSQRQGSHQVLSNVSGIKPTVKELSSNPVTVRQAPLTFMLSPKPISWRTVSAAIIRLSDLIALILPTSSIIPVNNLIPCPKNR
jgi:hypothetical protein